MKLVADSGSTKTDWYLVDDNKISTFSTQGYNPYYCTTAEVQKSLELELLGNLDQDNYQHFIKLTPEKRDSLFFNLDMYYNGVLLKKDIFNYYYVVRPYGVMNNQLYYYNDFPEYIRDKTNHKLN